MKNMNMGNGSETLPIYTPQESHKYGAVTTAESVNPSKFANLSTSDLVSIILIVVCVVVGDLARGILFPTLWPLVQALGGSPFYQGAAVSAFSFGRIVSSPIFGYVSEEYGYRYVLIVCNAFICLGALLYTMSESLSWLIFSQIVIGIGAGSLGVTRAFVAETTKREERTTYIAYLTAAQYAGFTLTPLLGAILASYAAAHNEGTVVFAGVHLDQYSLPALFLAGLSLATSGLLALLFKDVVRGAATEPEEQEETQISGEGLTDEGGIELSLVRGESPTSEGSDMTSTSSNTLYAAAVNGGATGRMGVLSSQRVCGCRLLDLMAVAGCLMNVTTKGTIGVFEAMGMAYVTRHYHWSTLQSGLTISFCGAVGVLVLLSFSLLLRCMDDVDLVYQGLLFMIVSCLLLGLFELPVPLFYLSIGLMYSVGYPVGHTALIGIFSKLIKSGPQGGLLGWFGSAGSFARVVFPLLAGTLTELFGDRVIFMVVAVMLIGACAVYGYFRGVIKAIVNE